MSKRKREDLEAGQNGNETVVPKGLSETEKTSTSGSKDPQNNGKTLDDESPRKKLKKSDELEEKEVATALKRDDKGPATKERGSQNKGDKTSGITKNECICPADAGASTLQTEFVKEEEAHIQVAEWRLHKFQSPIELKHDETIHHDHFEPLEYHGHWDEGGTATFTNNGFTATLRFQNRELPIIKGGPLHEDEFIFEQLHFHWSEDDHSGCEHIFEGQAYSMEAHAVHFNTKYADFNEAHDKHDGLAVVAFFIQATDNKNNPCFDKLSTSVLDIVKINATTSVPSDCLTWIREEAQCKGYYTYQGSLTTEPYTESVTWILYPQPIHVSREQVAHFRSLNSTPCEQHNIKKNVRPIQTPPEHKKLNILYARSHKPSL